ncbi:MAG: hypothetical protein V4760_17005 [Bdellovibrionota bacterium]
MKNTFALIAISLGLAFGSAESAQGQSIRGFIRTSHDGSVYLDVSAGEPPFRIEARHAQTEKDIRNLKLGDFLVARGTLDRGTAIAHVDTIETVGLRGLIGPWQSGSKRVYEFEDFSRLNLYRELRDSTGVTLSRFKQMNYTVAPEAGGRYSIFMSDNRSVQIGFLDFEDDGIELTVIDPKTGRVSENISLSPLPVK